MHLRRFRNFPKWVTCLLPKFFKEFPPVLEMLRFKGNCETTFLNSHILIFFLLTKQSMRRVVN